MENWIEVLKAEDLFNEKDLEKIIQAKAGQEFYAKKNMRWQEVGCSSTSIGAIGDTILLKTNYDKLISLKILDFKSKDPEGYLDCGYLEVIFKFQR